jgi:hypothetical protein
VTSLTAGCGALNVTDYSKACSADADCVAVFVGPACGEQCDPRCPNDAISVASNAKYETDFQRVISACPRPIIPRQCPVFVISPCDAVRRTPACRAGTCVLP